MWKGGMVAAERIAALDSKDDFLDVPAVAHLCAGGETAMLRSHQEVVVRFFQQKSAGMAGREDGLMGTLVRCRAWAAALLGVDPPCGSGCRGADRPPMGRGADIGAARGGDG